MHQPVVVSLVETIRDLPPSDQPALYVDLEGISLRRYGSVSIVTVYVLPRQHVYLVDVHALGSGAFDTAAADGTTKVFFDLLFLPILRGNYLPRLGRAWRAKVAEETVKRVLESRAPSYEPQTESRKFSPWT